ncbi:MAG: hypothetical protein HY928_04775, partial [Elusimicrobia bacterium]|nr:hypothetical protein [Elusimicrobiota bacterium]
MKQTILLSLLALGPIGVAKAYDSVTTHPRITEEAIEILSPTGDDPYPEIRRFRNGIVVGSSDEDFVIGLTEPLQRGIVGQTAVLQHFFNPTTRSGLRVPIFSRRNSALAHARELWNFSVISYSQPLPELGGLQISRERSYFALGRILHLLTQDLAQPGHTHDDAHPPHPILKAIAEDRSDLEFAAEKVAHDFPSQFPTGTRALLAQPSSSFPENELSPEDFGEELARKTYESSRFAGRFDWANGIGVVAVGSLISEARESPADADPLSPCAAHLHWEIVGNSFGRRLCFDPATEFDGLRDLSNDWWIIKQRLSGEAPRTTNSAEPQDEFVYFDRYDEVDIKIGGARKNLTQHFIAQNLPMAIEYSAGLLQLFANTVDPVAPTFQIREETLDGEIIAPNAFSRATRVAVEAVDDWIPGQPHGSGVHRLVLSRISPNPTSTSVEFKGEDVIATPPRPIKYFSETLQEGRYMMRIRDGLANETTAGFTIDHTPPSLTFFDANGNSIPTMNPLISASGDLFLEAADALSGVVEFRQIQGTRIVPEPQSSPRASLPRRRISVSGTPSIIEVEDAAGNKASITVQLDRAPVKLRVNASSPERTIIDTTNNPKLKSADVPDKAILSFVVTSRRSPIAAISLVSSTATVLSINLSGQNRGTFDGSLPVLEPGDYRLRATDSENLSEEVTLTVAAFSVRASTKTQSTYDEQSNSFRTRLVLEVTASVPIGAIEIRRQQTSPDAERQFPLIERFLYPSPAPYQEVALASELPAGDYAVVAYALNGARLVRSMAIGDRLSQFTIKAGQAGENKSEMDLRALDCTQPNCPAGPLGGTVTHELTLHKTGDTFGSPGQFESGIVDFKPAEADTDYLGGVLVSANLGPPVGSDLCGYGVGMTPAQAYFDSRAPVRSEFPVGPA